MKIGIIHCPKHAGFTSAAKRWQKIERALKENDIEYDLVQSENQQSVRRLVTMMIRNGYETILIAGGDSALNEAVNCLMCEETYVRERVCLGVIPNGTMNDFATFWGFSEKNIAKTAESIKRYRTRKVDVGKFCYTNKDGEKSVRYFLNCVNIGLIARIQRLRKDTRKWVWSRKASYLLSLVLTVFQKMAYKVKYTINYETEQRNIVTMCIGNCLGYGQTPNAVPYNGMIDVSVIKNSTMMQLFNGIGLFLRGKILNHKWLIPYRCRAIDLEIHKQVPVNIDSEPVKISAYHPNVSISVEQEAINFLIEA